MSSGRGSAVFVGPRSSRRRAANKAILREFLLNVKKRFERVVFEPPPGWDLDECDELTQEVGALAARDPLNAGLSRLKVAYYRLHGPAGHKSRYEGGSGDRAARRDRARRPEAATTTRRTCSRTSTCSPTRSASKSDEALERGSPASDTGPSRRFLCSAYVSTLPRRKRRSVSSTAGDRRSRPLQRPPRRGRAASACAARMRGRLNLRRACAAASASAA